MFEALSRRFLRWQLEVAKGGRRGLVCGIFAVLVLVSTALWVLSRRDSAVTSVLHPSTPFQALLNANVKFATTVTKNINVVESEDIFPQYGDNSLPGRHFRLENAKLLSQSSNKNVDSVLVMVVLKDAESWGQGRGAQDFMELLGSFDYPKEKMSVTVLTSSASEFGVMKNHFKDQIEWYSRLSVLFRDDFALPNVVTRENRHDNDVQRNRRRVIARYRNFALQATMELWHQHVVWLDADVHKIPSGLLKRMIRSGLDIVEPMCVRMKASGKDWYEYDLNAWVGQRKVRRSAQDSNFVPGDSSVQRMRQFHGTEETFVPLDSVGGTVLYVKADIHRQGVLFPVHHLIGSEWASEGYDGIETEGLCYVAHFLGFKCWGMPNDLIYHI
ncbi:Anp1 [Phytophthora infestans]|uniref:Anp1 n=1 Tax=Phytophthora infestans TaxID=4787 RepID=A0A8S9U804_PHYIN|nr:Anp1 [Phytophthora infestans]